MMSRLLLKLAGLFVPAARRREWIEEWSAELEALKSLRNEERAGDYPGAMSFVAGAFPHAIWILSLIHISEPTRRRDSSRMPSSA